MDADQLIAEGLRLARPSLVLRAGGCGGRPAGYWGGAGAVPPPPGDWRHWLTVECGWLHDQGLPLRGCLSLYEAAGDVLEFAALADAEKGLPEPLPGSTPLFGEEEPSIPPCEALTVCGSDAAYDREYQRRCPLYRDDVYAVLGGWHTFWPDMDVYDEEKGRLVLWTFHEAEPWIEVWLDKDGRLKAVPRVT